MNASICPECEGDSIVIDTEKTFDRTLRRRRKCLVCGFRWSTVETRVLSVHDLRQALEALRDAPKV